jgi:hypothetical protein
LNNPWENPSVKSCVGVQAIFNMAVIDLVLQSSMEEGIDEFL